MREKEIDLQSSMKEEEEKKKKYYRNGQSHHLSYIWKYILFFSANIYNQSMIEENAIGMSSNVIIDKRIPKKCFVLFFEYNQHYHLTVRKATDIFY